MKYYETKKKLKEYDPLFRAYDHQKADLRASYEEDQEMGEKRGLNSWLRTRPIRNDNYTRSKHDY